MSPEWGRIQRGSSSRRYGGIDVSLQPSVRRGLSLIEMLFAATGLVLLSVVGLTTICLLTTTEQRSAESLIVERTVASLADQLRADAHDAVTVDFQMIQGDVAEACTCTLQEGRQVTYTCEPDGVTRRESHGEQMLARERYRLPFGRSWFVASTRAGADVIVWWHERDVEMTAGTVHGLRDDEIPQRSFHVEAVVGLHQRWSDLSRGGRDDAPDSRSAGES